MKINDDGSLDKQLDLETYLANVSIGCSSPPRGKMPKIKLSIKRIFTIIFMPVYTGVVQYQY